jgi:hypothetical protein
MQEFQANEFITLKLEEGKTNIYIAGELFDQCKFLLLNISVKEISILEETGSVDEAAETLSKVMEDNISPWAKKKPVKPEIPPEVEFWAHCSNLQVWSEHNYDTRLIHSNLAFPLLKKLTEVGDQQAKRVFKEEIAKRLESGYWPVIEFLIKEEYTDYLSREEFLRCILGNEMQSQKEIDFLIKIEELIGHKLDLLDEYDPEYCNFVVENRHIVKLSIDTDSDINEVLPLIGNLYSLRVLIVSFGNLKKLPDSFGNLRELEYLLVSNNKLHELPQTMKELKNLKNLNLSINNFSKFPKVISNFLSLEELDLSGNHLRTMPEEIGNLTNLKVLWLHKNELEFIPATINRLESLKTLYLGDNKLRELPDTIEDLNNLSFLDLYKNNLKNSFEIIKRLKKKGIKIDY